MRLCTRAVAATQVTLYMAATNFGIPIGASLLGVSDKLGGIGPLFALIAVADIIAIGIMLTARFPTRQVDPEVAERLPQGDGLAPAIN